MNTKIDNDCGGESLRAVPQRGINIDAVLGETLKQRGNRYGPFAGHAAITQALKRVTKEHAEIRGVTLSDSQSEALDMIFHKVGRIVNGDPNYTDSWHDIAGYAQLVERELQGEEL